MINPKRIETYKVDIAGVDREGRLISKTHTVQANTPQQAIRIAQLLSGKKYIYITIGCAVLTEVTYNRQGYPL